MLHVVLAAFWKGWLSIPTMAGSFSYLSPYTRKLFCLRVHKQIAEPVYICRL